MSAIAAIFFLVLVSLALGFAAFKVAEAIFGKDDDANDF